MLLVLFAQQAVWANGTLTSRTRHLLKTGLLFKLEKIITGDDSVIDHYHIEAIKRKDALERTIALREIYLKPNGADEAHEIVEAEHGVEGLDNFYYLLKLQETADSFGIEVDFKGALAVKDANSRVLKDIDGRALKKKEIEELKDLDARLMEDSNGRILTDLDGHVLIDKKTQLINDRANELMDTEKHLELMEAVVPLIKYEEDATRKAIQQLLDEGKLTPEDVAKYKKAIDLSNARLGLD